MPKSYRTVEVCQQIEYGMTKEKVSDILSEWSSVKDYAFILHDKDTRSDGTLKEPHIHLMLRFKDSVPTTAILNKFNNNGVSLSEQNLEKCKKWVSAIAYLVHDTQPDKYRYDDSEVVSNFDWQSDMIENRHVIKNGRLRDIIQCIDSGKIKQYNKTDFISSEEYAMWKTKIDNAFRHKFESDRRDFLKGDYDMKVVYMSGPSGCGKTSLAKQACKNFGFEYCVSSGSNDPLQDYQGEEALIMDDFRPSDMRLSDLLKMTDHNTRSSVPSRYYNKFLTCKMLIFTSTIPLIDFCKALSDTWGEDVVQIRRRIKEYYDMDEQNVRVYHYNESLRDYKYYASFPNPVTVMFKAETASNEEILDNVLKFANAFEEYGINVGKDVLTLADDMQVTLNDFKDGIPFDLPYECN